METWAEVDNPISVGAEEIDDFPRTKILQRRFSEKQGFSVNTRYNGCSDF